MPTQVHRLWYKGAWEMYTLLHPGLGDTLEEVGARGQ